MAFFLLVTAAMPAEAVFATEPTHELALSASLIMGLPMIGIEATFLPVDHFAGSLRVSFPLLGHLTEQMVVGLESYIKVFIAPENTGPYIAVGPMYVLPHESMGFSFFITAIGYKAILFEFLVLDFAIFAPPDTLFMGISTIANMYSDNSYNAYASMLFGSAIRLNIGIRW